jgi:hypothetical protein
MIYEGFGKKNKDIKFLEQLTVFSILSLGEYAMVEWSMHIF